MPISHKMESHFDKSDYNISIRLIQVGNFKKIKKIMCKGMKCMSYEMAMIEALVKGDKRRIESIQRLNSPRSYWKYNSWNEELEDKLIALSGKNSKEIYASSIPRRIC